jgi:spore maturation protein SpmA
MTEKNMTEKKDCPYSKCSWLLIPLIIAIVTGWILKTTDSIFSGDPLSVWFSILLSAFVGVWMVVGLKRIMCHKDHTMTK